MQSLEADFRNQDGLTTHERVSEALPMVLLGDKPDWREAVFKTPGTRHFIVSILPFEEDVIQSDSIDIIMPLSLYDYDVLRRYPAALTKCLMPSAPTVHLANDKALFNRWLIRNGCGKSVPRIYSNCADLKEFPVIRKKRTDEWGKESRIFHSEADLRLANSECSPGDYYIQAYIAGKDEYVTHIIALNGTITFGTTFVNTYDCDIYVKGLEKHEMGYEIINGFVPPELSDIIRRLRYTGCTCFNYKYIGNVPMIFEMNPRVGGSFTRDLSSYIMSYIRTVEAKQFVKQPSLATRLKDAVHRHLALRSAL